MKLPTRLPLCDGYEVTVSADRGEVVLVHIDRSGHAGPPRRLTPETALAQAAALIAAAEAASEQPLN